MKKFLQDLWDFTKQMISEIVAAVCDAIREHGINGGCNRCKA